MYDTGLFLALYINWFELQVYMNNRIINKVSSGTAFYIFFMCNDTFL